MLHAMLTAAYHRCSGYTVWFFAPLLLWLPLQTSNMKLMDHAHDADQSRELRGSSASRNPSPRKLRANKVIDSANPGVISSQGYSSMVSTP